MSDEKKDEGSFVGFYIIAAALLIFIGAGMGSCSTTDAYEKAKPDPKADRAAIAFFDCDQMVVAAFFANNGDFQQIPIRGNAMLIDVQLRLAKMDYNAVQYVQNQRPCAISFGQDDLQ